MASSHQSRCSGNCVPQSTIGHVTNTTSVQHDATVVPSLEDIYCLKVQTLRHIPSYALPAFACALSAALRCVLHENTLEAWIKLLLLPKSFELLNIYTILQLFIKTLQLKVTRCVWWDTSGQNCPGILPLA